MTPPQAMPGNKPKGQLSASAHPFLGLEKNSRGITPTQVSDQLGQDQIQRGCPPTSLLCPIQGVPGKNENRMKNAAEGAINRP